MGLWFSAVTWRVMWIIRCIADSRPVSTFGQLSEQHDVIHKTWSTQCIALSSEEDQAMATGNTYRKLCEVLTWFLWYASEQRDIQTQQSQYFCTSPSSKVMTKYTQEWIVYAGFVQKTVCGFPHFSRKKIMYFQNFSRWFLPPHTHQRNTSKSTFHDKIS